MNPLVCHRRRRDALGIITDLNAKALGRQDHTISPSVSVPLVGRHLHVHRIPAPHLVTIAKRPSASEAGWREEMLIFGSWQEEYFSLPILKRPLS